MSSEDKPSKHYYDLEVIHTITYKRRVLAEDKDEAIHKGNEMWMNFDKERIADENAEVMASRVDGTRE